MKGSLIIVAFFALGIAVGLNSSLFTQNILHSSFFAYAQQLVFILHFFNNFDKDTSDTSLR